MFELEAIINELTLSMDDNIDNLRIYERLRMNLIHGQICLAHFWKWKDNSRQKQAKEAQDTFKNTIKFE